MIILNFNTGDLLVRCLRSVLASEVGQLRVEVIVVDNGSTDNSVGLVKKLILARSRKKDSSCRPAPVKPAIKLVESKKNLGFAAGNNLGLAEARGSFILFLNSDTEIKPFALKKAVDLMKTSPRVGALTVKTMLPNGKMDPDCHRGFPTPWASLTYFFGLEKLFPRSRLFGQYHQLYKDLEKVHEVDAGAGAFMLVDRKVIEKIGNLDERYFFYGEDLDYFYRIKQAGWKVLFYPQALLIHHKGASSGLRKESKSKVDRKTRLKVARASIEAMQIFYRKFYQDKYPRWMTSMVLVGIRFKGYSRLIYHLLRK